MSEIKYIEFKEKGMSIPGIIENKTVRVSNICPAHGLNY